jgi:hypothetical protein
LIHEIRETTAPRHAAKHGTFAQGWPLGALGLALTWLAACGGGGDAVEMDPDWCSGSVPRSDARGSDGGLRPRCSIDFPQLRVNRDVDLLVVVDNSGSMAEAQ